MPREDLLRPEEVLAYPESLSDAMLKRVQPRVQTYGDRSSLWCIRRQYLIHEGLAGSIYLIMTGRVTDFAKILSLDRVTTWRPESQRPRCLDDAKSLNPHPHTCHI